ncbi:MAG: putative methyltransferase [Herminiimonas sp.]|nr:putative methyltransferase [Herminiimonas sp.]
MTQSLAVAISSYGSTAKAKLTNAAVKGAPEDQLRAPFEQLLKDLAELIDLPHGSVIPIGESSLSDLKTRPDYAVIVHGSLAGFVEIKAPGKGADPRKFKGAHDKGQWDRLRSLPNLIYTDGNEFSLWHSGELVGSVVRLSGDIATSGDKLQAGDNLLGIFESFLRWEPIPPNGAKELAEVSARLCRLLRDEVTEQLAIGSAALSSLADDWRKLLFPDASNERFADGYAQAVTFGLLMARAKGISFSEGLDHVARELGKSSSLIGAALRLLTDDAGNQQTLKTSLGTLTRVLSVVDWNKISKGNPEAWLYFYEDFLEVYDSALRKQTGSYYTPPEVVSSMVRLVDEALRSSKFNQHRGLASPAVTLADPATGTGTFLLGVLRKIAETVEEDEGKGAVGNAINEAMKRLIAFEIQLGPFAVAQLRILAEVVELTGAAPKNLVRMFVTDTLGNPDDDQGWIPGLLEPIAKSRKEANKIKRDEPITVVIGNPPYKEKAKGRGGWIEGETPAEEKSAPLSDWMPPREWGVGAHTKHLRNLYAYFWRWATWKVFDHHPTKNTGIVCYITVAGFLGGQGFQKMRDYLRRRCDDIWVVDCSPEGHQPEVNSRIFQGVQQPVCIVLASRSADSELNTPATVHFRALPVGRRNEKFEALKTLRLNDSGWIDCPAEWRAPFLPASTGAWATYPALVDLFSYNGSGVMPGRTWVIAPDSKSLQDRWKKLVSASAEDKEALFHPHLRNGKVGDKHSKKVSTAPLAGYEATLKSVADEEGSSYPPIPYGFRSFDRQWIIPDSRLINQPNRELWEIRSDSQIYLTTLSSESPTAGPALTVSALIPDMDHYSGRGGRVYPLWGDRGASLPNLKSKLVAFLTEKFSFAVSPEDVVAYIVAIAAHPAYTRRFQGDLSTPGLRIPISSKKQNFLDAVGVGRRVIWLHTFGERMTEQAKGGSSKPRLPLALRPRIPLAGTIPSDEGTMPESIKYDGATKRLLVGSGHVENVEPAVWLYEISGRQVLTQWFSYRKKNRERPIIGDRRPPSHLGNLQPNYWLAEYTTELLDLLNVLGMLVELEPAQETLLEEICAGPCFSVDEIRAAGVFEDIFKQKKSSKLAGHPDLFGELDLHVLESKE